MDRALLQRRSAGGERRGLTWYEWKVRERVSGEGRQALPLRVVSQDRENVVEVRVVSGERMVQREPFLY